MRPHDDFLEEVTTAIRRELANCAQLRREARTELGKTEPNPRVLGSIMHDFYNCCERVFRRIGAEINGTSYRGDAGHKELLFRHRTGGRCAPIRRGDRDVSGRAECAGRCR